MAEDGGLVRAAQEVLDAVEEFWGSGCRDSYMVKHRSADVFRAMRNAWMVARSCRSVAEGSGGGFVGNSAEVQRLLHTIRSFVEIASRAELDPATMNRELQSIGETIDGVDHHISGSWLDRHILGEWITAVREVDAAKEEVIRHQEVFNRQIEAWQSVSKTSFGASRPYTAAARGANTRAVLWAIGAGLLVVVTVCYGFSLELDVGETGRTLGDALYASAGRWAAFAVLIGAVTWCGRRASANAHLAAIARDRASAWDSYQVLVASGGSAAESARALAQKLFDTPSTGYLAKAAPSSGPSMPLKLDG